MKMERGTADEKYPPKEPHNAKNIVWNDLKEEKLTLLKLKLFFYFLLKYHLTIGDLTDLLEDAETHNNSEFSNHTLYGYACEIIERLLDE